jgi:hypothetical protein
MRKLFEYKSHDEKKENFTIKFINSKEELDTLINSFSSPSKSIWRGINESKFKHYTSLQRFWIENDFSDDIEEVLKYIDFIEKDCKEWNGKLLENYFKNYNSEKTTLFSILSILRHYGAPTPFLDWTRNPEVALFFSANDSRNDISNSKIDNYFCLYELKENHQINQFNYKKIAGNYWKLEEKSILELNKISPEKNPDYIFDFTNAYLNDNFILKDRLKNNLKYFSIEDSHDDNLKFFINNNYNITNQSGLFILNFHPKVPLENAINMHINLESIHGIEHLKKCKSRNIDNFYCYEIHKSLKEYLLSKLSVNNDFLFPDLNKMAKKVLNNYLKKNKPLVV